jgi:arginase
MHKDITFLINPSEITAGTRGASLGPAAIMTAARKNNSTLFGAISQVIVPDANAVLDKLSLGKFAKNADALLQVYLETSNRLSDLLLKNQFPFVLAGDHGSAGGTIAGIKKAFPEKRLGVVWIDAHGDIHSPYTTPSGNMHGMPLSTALNEDNLICKVNEISLEEKASWDELKNIHGIAPKILPEDLVFVGVRDLEEQEIAVIDRLNIRNFTVDELRNEGAKSIVDSILNKLADCDLIYISFDVDSMDPILTSHGTGTPVVNGLYPSEAEGIITGLIGSQKVCCIEFVEINPCLDEKQNKMAEIAFEMIEKIIPLLNN